MGNTFLTSIFIDVVLHEYQINGTNDMNNKCKTFPHRLSQAVEK